MKFKVECINKLKAALTLIYVVLIAAFAYFFQDVFNFFEEKFIDLRASLSVDGGLYSQRYKSADENIVIISVNDITQYEAARSSELNLTRWPWSRVVWARVISFLEKQNPKVIVVDLNFSNYEDLSRNYTSPDMILADTLGYYDNIVLATALRTPYSEAKKTDSAKILDNFANPYSPTNDALNLYTDDEMFSDNISYYSHTPIPNIFTNSTTMGVTNLVTGKNKGDNVRYSQPVYKLIKGNKEYYIPSVALAAMMKYEGLGKKGEEFPVEDGFLKLGKHHIRIDEQGKSLINWHGSGNSYLDIPVNSILLSMVRGSKSFEYDKTQYPLSFFKDKIIIIAQTHLNTETHNTPVAKEMTDAQIKANIIDNYINDSDITNRAKRQFVKHIAPYKGILITAAFCCAIIFVIAIATNMLLAFVNSSLIVLIYIIFSILLYVHPRFRLLLDMAEPLYYMLAVFAVAFGLKLHHEYKKRKKIERIFGNLVSEKVLKQLVDKPHKLNLKSTVQKVTVMSCNIFNNIQISEKLTPEKYVELINNAFNTIEDVIFSYNGTINRFVGNSVLVYWGYPIHSRKDSENAIRAALEIQEKIEKFNQTHTEKIVWDRIDENDNVREIPEDIKQKFVNVKIAINTGTALIGQIGSSNVSDFTVMGETVDVLEKMENICAEFGKDIIVTEETLNHLDRPVPAEYIGQIKAGKSGEKLKIYELKQAYNRGFDEDFQER